MGHLHHRHRSPPAVLGEKIEARKPQNTAVEVVYVTMANTYTGDIVWVTMGDDKPSSKPKSQAAQATSNVKATSSAQSKVTSSTTRSPSPKATSSPEPSSSQEDTKTDSEIRPSSVTSPAANNIIVASQSSTVAAAAATTAASSDSASSGMSGGAKAGLALGILIALGGILALVLLLYRKKKQQQEGSKQLNDNDNEKAIMSNSGMARNDMVEQPPPVPKVESAPSIRSAKTASTAPRLSLRPVTQFSPNFTAENRKSAGTVSTLGAAAMGAHANGSREQLTPASAEKPASAWERRGAQNAQNNVNDPANPFGNHAERIDISPMQPPPQVPLPQTPNLRPEDKSLPPSVNHSPVNSISSGPAPSEGAVAGAAVGGAASVAAAAGLPKPLSLKAGPVESPLASPASAAWTEDIPASPGPAPTGAPPAAIAAMGPGPNNVHRVQMDFVPSMEDELEIHAGSLVRMLHEYDDGWALCVRMDRSKQGVVPRSCLSKHPVKPRQPGPPRNGPPRARGPMGPPPNMGGGFPRPPSSGRNSPGPFANPPRPLSPASQGPNGQTPRMSPPGGRPRAFSNASGPPRSMSPGPNSGPRPQDPQGRRRSNSASQVMARRNSPPGPSKMNPAAIPGAPVPARKPVPGQAS